jgi:hypothetical protein
MAGALTPTFGSIKPSQQQQALHTNYLNFTDPANDGFVSFAQQYLPEIYEAEVERYGNRTLSGFLRMVGAEMPMSSDQVIWSEQNRLHVAYTGVATVSAAGNTLLIPSTVATPGVTSATYVANVISKNQTIVIMDPETGLEVKAVVTLSGANDTSSNAANGALTVAPYTAATLAAAGFTDTMDNLKIFVYGSEYQKGSTLAADNYTSIQPSFTQYNNSPVIIRNKYVVNGSDTAQIGWVNITTEDGADGFYWYLKAESETRLRFEDYLEMTVVEGELATDTSAAALTAGKKGTQGLFSAIDERGNVIDNFTVAGAGYAALADFDAILKNLDTQGAIEENMLFLNRALSLDFDNMLASLSAGTAGGTAFGLFENSEEMALNLGFSGFRRGSYDFYKTDWKYLNDASTRGAMNSGTNVGSSIQGVLIPAGTSTIYDQILGTNIRRPFLHVRYRAAQADDRRMKSWVTGSVGGAYTSDLDAMEVHFLSERCLCVQGANNFVLFTASEA